VHRLTVNLHPVDLGPVQIVAEIRNGEISMQLSGSTEAGHQSLRDAMDDLRRELQQSGFANCSLDLRQGSGNQASRHQQFADVLAGRGRSTGPATVATPETPAARITPSRDDRRLDLHV
jgi:flagellar hook-length control protein FliK